MPSSFFLFRGSSWDLLSIIFLTYFCIQKHSWLIKQCLWLTHLSQGSLTVAMFQPEFGVSRSPIPQLYSLLNPLHVLRALFTAATLVRWAKDSILLIQRSFSPLLMQHLTRLINNCVRWDSGNAALSWFPSVHKSCFSSMFLLAPPPPGF